MQDEQKDKQEEDQLVLRKMKMKAKTQFLKMFYKLPEEARPDLVFDAYGKRPMSLAVIAAEVRAGTKLGKQTLKQLGYTDKQSKVN